MGCHHITRSSRLFTYIQSKSELHSLLCFGGSYNCSKYLPPGHVYHAPGLVRFFCEVMTSQEGLGRVWEPNHVVTALEFRFCTCSTAGTRTCRRAILGSQMVEVESYLVLSLPEFPTLQNFYEGEMCNYRKY